MSLVFENRDTVLSQVQEMVRAERLVEPEKTQFELDIYNTLLPGPGELSATLFIEITGQDDVREELDAFLGLDGRAACSFACRPRGRLRRPSRPDTAPGNASALSTMSGSASAPLSARSSSEAPGRHDPYRASPLQGGRHAQRRRPAGSEPGPGRVGVRLKGCRSSRAALRPLAAATPPGGRRGHGPPRRWGEW